MGKAKEQEIPPRCKEERMGKAKEQEIPGEPAAEQKKEKDAAISFATPLPEVPEAGQKKEGQRFSLSRLLIKITGRAFLFTVAWLFIAFRAVVYSPEEPWVGSALLIAGCVTGLNIMGDKIVDAIATAIGNTKISLGSAKYSGPTGYGGIPLL
jgi:hypothetical protein